MRSRPIAPSLTALLVAIVLGCSLGAPSHATAPDIAALCDRAALTAADTDTDTDTEEVPFDILRAITRVETGRSLDGFISAWPWAANASGDGAWFETEDAALRHVEIIIASGRHNLDVGCVQLNHRWHADDFSTLNEMIDPEANARYPARFPRRSHSEFGDGDAAVATHHSRTPACAARYQARFHDISAGLTDAPVLHGSPARAPVSGPSPLDLDSQPSLLTRASGLRSQSAAPLLSVRPALSLFGDRP